MKLVEERKLSLPGISVVTFARFPDHRGYFTEHFRDSQFRNDISFLADVTFVQANESFSRKGVVRGLHFQWNPFMGKLVRTVHGTMVDLFLDIRKGSPTYGMAAAYEISAKPGQDSAEWIWVPPGFAHGNYFTEDTTIEYFCSGEYSPGCEAGISPLADDVDWSLCDPRLKEGLDRVLQNRELMSDKDVNGLTMAQWSADERSGNFLYEDLA
jgi:dTDP-4-dehydrorhamnose 3,5-epimerase